MQPTGYGHAPPERLDATFAALADPTRRAILARLASGEASVTELAEPFAMSQPAISKHLKVLEQVGLISRGRDAQRRPCRLEAVPLAEANQWLEGYRRYWESSFRRLDALLDEMKAKSKRRAVRGGARPKPRAVRAGARPKRRAVRGAARPKRSAREDRRGHR
jgi:DNA-binding transcriptional ArsR family regulator